MTPKRAKSCFTKVDAVDADRIHLADAIRAAHLPAMAGVSAAAAKLTLLVFLSHMNGDGGTWRWEGLTMGQLSHEVGSSRRHMRRIRKGLESAGVLVTEQRNWSTNAFELQVDAILEWGRHGKAMMDSERARRRSDSVRVKRDASYHQEVDGEVVVNHDVEVIAGAVPDSYSEEAWRSHNPARIFLEAFREWPQLGANKRAARRLFNERTGEARSIAAWHRDCQMVAAYLREGEGKLAQWALRGASLPEGERALRITSTAGWGQLLHAAHAGTLLAAAGVNPAGPAADPLAGTVDVGQGRIPAPMESMVKLWASIRKQVSERANDARMDEVWLSKGRALGVEDDRLIIDFPNRYYVEYVAEQAGIDWEAVDIPIRLTWTG